MTVPIDGGPVVAHAQAFADEINRRWGFTHILTYPGHEPDQQHALDNFQTRDVMLALADWCTHDDVIDRYGIDYVIFNVDESTVGGEIYNREIARYWRHMPDRGSPTQNHHDHVHVSFNPTAKGPFGPSPEENDLTDAQAHQLAAIVGWFSNPIYAGGPDLYNSLIEDHNRLDNIEKAVAAIKAKVGA